MRLYCVGPNASIPEWIECTSQYSTVDSGSGLCVASKSTCLSQVILKASKHLSHRTIYWLIFDYRGLLARTAYEIYIQYNVHRHFGDIQNFKWGLFYSLFPSQIHIQLVLCVCVCDCDWVYAACVCFPFFTVSSCVCILKHARAHTNTHVRNCRWLFLVCNAYAIYLYDEIDFIMTFDDFSGCTIFRSSSTPVSACFFCFSFLFFSDCCYFHRHFMVSFATSDLALGRCVVSYVQGTAGANVVSCAWKCRCLTFLLISHYFYHWILKF